jgi:hypothetical protein
MPSRTARRNPESVRPAGIFAGIVDPDARARNDGIFIDVQAVILDPDRAVQQAAARQRSRYTQRPCDRTGTRQQRAIGTRLAASFEHGGKPGMRLACSDQHSVRYATYVGDHVEEMMNAVA